ncbi:MAG: hypothetical protein ACF8NJ_10290 [Phycisphaerales bacterium JB038]
MPALPLASCLPASTVWVLVAAIGAHYLVPLTVFLFMTFGPHRNISWQMGTTRIVPKHDRGPASRQAAQVKSETTDGDIGRRMLDWAGGQCDGPAYHEAGHAVVCVLLGVPFESVSLDSKSSAEYGRAIVLQRNPVVSMAGPVAEALAMERPSTDALRMHSGRQDRQDVLDTLPADTADPEVALARFVSEAERLLRANWPQLKAVAYALGERRTLTAAEVRALTSPGVE